MQYSNEMDSASYYVLDYGVVSPRRIHDPHWWEPPVLVDLKFPPSGGLAQVASRSHYLSKLEEELRGIVAIGTEENDGHPQYCRDLQFLRYCAKLGSSE